MNLIIIFILILLLSPFIKRTLIEPYDDRKIDTPMEKCADFCKKITGCVGFAYNKNDNTCYSSQSPLTGRPIEGVYTAFSKDTDILCNKLSSIKKIEDKYSPYALKANATYVCKSPDDSTKMYLHENNRYEEIVNLDKYKKSPYSEIYKLDEYKWPLNTYSDKQINKSEGKRLHKREVKEEEYENNRQRILSNSENIIINQKNLGFGTTTSSIQVSKTDKKNIDRKSYTYKKSNRFSDGEYLKPEKRCLTDVKLEECLSYCSQNNECDGVEYNLYYKQNGSGNQNICCPKLNIGNLVERDEKNKYGNVYIKQM